MPPTIKTVRARAALVLLVLAALVATLPGMTIAPAPAGPPPLTLRRPDGDDDDSDDETDDADTDEDEDEDDSDTDETEDDDAEDGDDDEVDEDELPDSVKAILKKNRDAVKAAEKRASKAERDARKARRDARQKPPVKKDPPKKKPATGDDTDDEPKGPDAGTVKLRQVNLRDALQAKGYTAQRAKAVARLLDDVEYDDDDEPVDIDDALQDAIEAYGEDVAGKGTGEKPKPKRKTNTGGREGNRGGKAPKLTADELKAAEESGMDPAYYEELKGVKTHAEWAALRKKYQAKKQ